MLPYHPATDFFHCWMRIASIVLDSPSRCLEFDRVRIVDFLLSFPREIAAVRLPREAVALRSSVRTTPEGYVDPASRRQAFVPMGKIQAQVCMDMVAKKLLVPEEFRDGKLCISSDASALELMMRVSNKWAQRQEPWHGEALSALLNLPLNSNDGLKHRTGLMEHRYD